MADVPVGIISMGAIAAIIVIGYLSEVLFKKTRIPGLLILMGIGILIGPYGLNYISPADLGTVLPIFTVLALVVILFDGGLGLHLKTVLKGAPLASLFTVFVFVGSLLITAGVSRYFMQWTWQDGILLGAIVGGTSSATVLGLLSGLQVTERTRTLLSLESSITDVLAITTLLALLQLYADPSAGIQQGLNSLAGQFSIGIVAGAISAIAWAEIVRRADTERLDYMVTLGIVLGLYATVEFIQGSGAVAALVFGLMLANWRSREGVPTNAPLYQRKREAQEAEEATEDLRTFHGELAFLLRTLFFLVLGIQFPLAYPGHKLVIAITLVLTGWVLVRYVVAIPVGKLGTLGKRDKFALTHMFPRGMVAAVLATIPGSTLLPDGTPLVTQARTDQFVTVAFVLIGVTTIWASIAVLMAGRMKESYEKGETAEGNETVTPSKSS